MIVPGLISLLIAGQTVRENIITFPRDRSVINLKLDLGAKGDGVTDDTEALQKGFDQSSGINGASRILFIPKGTYRVTKTIVAKNALGPWIYGESRTGTIIKLQDGVTGVNSVIRTHPNEEGGTSADWFMRNLRNFTIDVGNNPETDGIRYYANNTGSLQGVTVRGNGKIGINSSFLGLSGPNLIQDVLVEGFETGILSQWIWGQTISRATIRNCRKEGVVVSANAVGIENLTVEKTPRALLVDIPNDWFWWSGVVSIVNSKFTGLGKGPAITNRGVLYARNVFADRFDRVIESNSAAGNVNGGASGEYSSYNPISLWDTGGKGLALPIKFEPSVDWENNPNNWVCANDFGAIPGDNIDDSAAIQSAINAAASAKKTVVYLRGIEGGDPNWYDIKQPVFVKGTVRHILGLGFGRILGTGEGKLIIDENSAPVVRVQSIDSFGGPPLTVENRSLTKTLVVQSCGVHIVGNGSGEIYATDCASSVDLQKPGQRMWARQLNPEGTSDTGLVVNRGGILWALGLKSEGAGVKFSTLGGGKTELLGFLMYGPGLSNDDARPMINVDNAQFSLQGFRELSFGNLYLTKIREKRGTETRQIQDRFGNGWLSWPILSAWKP